MQPFFFIPVFEQRQKQLCHEQQQQHWSPGSWHQVQPSSSAPETGCSPDEDEQQTACRRPEPAHLTPIPPLTAPLRHPHEQTSRLQLNWKLFSFRN